MPDGTPQRFDGMISIFNEPVDEADGTVDASGGPLDAAAAPTSPSNEPPDGFHEASGASNELLDPVTGRFPAPGGALDSVEGSLEASNGPLDASNGPLSRFGAVLETAGEALNPADEATRSSIEPMKAVLTEPPIALELSTLRRQIRRALAAVLLFAVVGATSCTPKPVATKSELNDRAISPPPRLGFEMVRSILEDSKGNYWFGSWNEGVARFDGKSLTYFTKDDGLSDNQIRSIREDRKGVVWFEGGSGLSGFDGEKIITPTSRSYDSKEAWKLEPGDLWFKEDGGMGAIALEGRPGVYRYDGKTFTYLAYPLPEDPSKLSAYATTSMATGKGGRLWFATYSAVFGYDGKSFTVIDDKRLGLDERTGWLHVRSVFEDSKGNLWIGNNGIGVLLWDGRTATRFTQEKGLGKMGPHGGRATPQPGDVTDGSPTLHRVFSIGEDREGNIWFGTVESGAWRYDGKSLKNYTAADGLTSPDIMGIYTDRQGDLWLAGKGVFKFNGTSFDQVF